MKRLTLWLLALVLIAGAFNKLPEGFESVAPPEAEPIHGEVIVDALNLRDAPSLDGERIGGLTLGQRVELVAWNVGRDDAYLWVEVETEAGRGFAAAYRREDWDYEREVEITREDYLAWEHDFGEYELTASFDLDRDGTEDVVRVGPDMEGLNGSQYPNAVG